MAERDEELQHGSTVLPGAPMPWFAQPHGAEPEPVDAGPPKPQATPVDEVQDEPVLDQPDEASVEVEEPTDEVAADVAPVAEDSDEAVAADSGEPDAEPDASDPPVSDEADAADATVAAVPAVPVHGRHRAPEPERTGSRRLLVLLVILGAVLVIAAVVLFVWPGLLTSSSADDGALPPPAAPSPSAPATVTLVVPATLAGLAKLSGAADSALRGAVSGTAVAGLTSPVSAVYGAKGVASAQVIAWKATAPPAQDSVDAAFTGFEGSSGAKVTAVRPLAVGALGGRMSCGETTVSKTPSLLCFWADEVSFGSVTLLSPKDRAAAEATAAKIRAGVEQKG